MPHIPIERILEAEESERQWKEQIERLLLEGAEKLEKPPVFRRGRKYVNHLYESDSSDEDNDDDGEQIEEERKGNSEVPMDKTVSEEEGKYRREFELRKLICKKQKQEIDVREDFNIAVDVPPSPHFSATILETSSLLESSEETKLINISTQDDKLVETRTVSQNTSIVMELCQNDTSFMDCITETAEENSSRANSDDIKKDFSNEKFSTDGEKELLVKESKQSSVRDKFGLSTVVSLCDETMQINGGQKELSIKQSPESFFHDDKNSDTPKIIPDFGDVSMEVPSLMENSLNKTVQIDEKHSEFEELCCKLTKINFPFSNLHFMAGNNTTKILKNKASVSSECNQEYNIPDNRNVIFDKDNQNWKKKKGEPLISFKTPRKSCIMIPKLLHNGSNKNTPIFTRKSIYNREQSSPNEQHICSRYAAHHASFASQQFAKAKSIQDMEKSTPTGYQKLVSKIPLLCSKINAQKEPTKTTEKLATGGKKISCKSPSLPNGSSITRKSQALKNIIDYNSSYEKTDESGRSPLMERFNITNTGQPNVSSLVGTPPVKSCHSKPQLPMTFYAYKHLQNGGTPWSNKKIQKNLSHTSLSENPLHSEINLEVPSVIPVKDEKTDEKTFESVDTPTFIAESKKANSSTVESITLFTPIRPANDISHLVFDGTPSSGLTEKHNLSRKKKILLPRKLCEKSEQQPDTTAVSNKPSKILVFDTTTTSTKNGEEKSFMMYMMDTTNNCVLGDSLQATDSSEVLPEAICSSSLNESGDGLSNVHVVASSKKKPVIARLIPPKIVHPASTEESGLRRSNRNRVRRLRHWLGEEPVYRRDEQGNLELVGVTDVEITDPLCVRTNTIDAALALEREKKATMRRNRLRQERKTRKMQRIKELKARHRMGLDLDKSIFDIISESNDPNEITN